MNKIKDEYLELKEILKGNVKSSDIAKEKGTSRQNVNLKLHIFINKIKEDKEYIEIFSKIKDDKNKKIVELKLDFTNVIYLDVFLYENRKHIYKIKDKIYYSTLNIKELNKMLNTSTNLKETLELNNIKVDDTFIENYILTNPFFKAINGINYHLRQHNKPVEKKPFIKKMVDLGYKEQTINNIISLSKNNNGRILNLGSHICDTEIFFNEYIDINLANKIVLSAGAICEKEQICSTDVKWLREKIEKNYKDINLDKYNNYELKAILCKEENLFKKGVRFNISYISNNCRFAPENISQLIEKILSKYTLPISLTFLSKKIKENGKNFSLATLSSLVLSTNDNFIKIENAGWILKENKEYAEKFLKKVVKLGREKLFNILNQEFKVGSLKDLAGKLNLDYQTVYLAYKGTKSLEKFITKLNEKGFKMRFNENEFLIKK